MTRAISITKMSGEQELFQEEKLRSSLQRAGISSAAAERIAKAIARELYDGISTKEIYRRAFRMLRADKPFLAARYNLKQAIFELGPTGFPFEQYVAELLRAEGCRVQTNQMVQGRCVMHEVDLIGEKDNEHFLVEAKYHNAQSGKTDVKVALYVQARFEDIRARWESEKDHASRGHEFHRSWIVTNTRFTSEAIAYGRCMGMELVGWGYPKGNSLQERIERAGLHPITALTTLSRQGKGMLLKEGVMLCKAVPEHQMILRGMGLPEKKIRTIAQEATATCQLPYGKASY